MNHTLSPDRELRLTYADSSPALLGETAISLGVDPVIGADWFGYTKTRSWVKKALKGAPAPALVAPTQLPYEKIAAANPDLILYVNSLNDEAVYHKLAEIAPTIAASASVKNAYGVRWQDQLATIAKSTITTQRAKTVLADTNAIMDRAKKANPEFHGKTITAGVFTNNSMSAWFPSDPRMQLLQQLGFKVNKQISKLDNGSFYSTLSDEQLELMNADLIFLAARDASGKAVTDNSVFHALSTVRAGHVAYWPGPGVVNTNTAGGDFSSALSIGGPLGIAYSMPTLIPMLRAALAGNKDPQ